MALHNRKQMVLRQGRMKSSLSRLFTFAVCAKTQPSSYLELVFQDPKINRLGPRETVHNIH
jgi:hypothetical protein